MKPNFSTTKVTQNSACKYKAICQRVRKLRMEKQLTQNEMAELLGVTRVNLNAIERGIHAPSIETLKILKTKFRVSYDWLIDGR